MKREYETTFILDARLSPEKIDTKLTDIDKIIKENGGKVSNVDRIGKRRLAYVFYLTGAEEGYQSMIQLGENSELINFIISLSESADKAVLGRVVEGMKRTAENEQVLELLDILDAEVLQGR